MICIRSECNKYFGNEQLFSLSIARHWEMDRIYSDIPLKQLENKSAQEIMDILTPMLGSLIFKLYPDANLKGD